MVPGRNGQKIWAITDDDPAIKYREASDVLDNSLGYSIDALPVLDSDTDQRYS